MSCIEFNYNIFLPQGPKIVYGQIYEIYIGVDCELSKNAHLIHASFSSSQVTAWVSFATL